MQLQNKETIISVMTHSCFVTHSDHVEKFDYHMSDIGKILYAGVLLKCVETFEFCLKTERVTVGLHENVYKFNILSRVV